MVAVMAKNKGRKALPAAQRRSRHLHAYFTPPEYTLLRQTKKRSETWSDFIRRLILPAAEAIASERATALQASPPIPPAPSPVEPALVTAEEVAERLKQVGIWGRAAYAAARKDPQRVADILDEMTHDHYPADIYNRIVHPRA